MLSVPALFSARVRVNIQVCFSFAEYYFELGVIILSIYETGVLRLLWSVAHIVRDVCVSSYSCLLFCCCSLSCLCVSCSCCLCLHGHALYPHSYSKVIYID